MVNSAEKIALGMLKREGIAAVWDLHLDAAMLYSIGQREQAEALLDMADAAEKIVRSHIWRSAATPSS